MRSLRSVLALACVVAGATAAAAYENTTFNYAIELPAGWQATAKADSAVALFAAEEHGLTVKVSAVAKPAAMGAAEIERVRTADENALKKRIAQYKTASFATPALIGGTPATNYGFVYRDEKGLVLVNRYAVISKSRGADHVWVRFVAQFPKAKLATATPALEKLMAAFAWKLGETPAVDAPPTVAPSEPPPTTTAIVKPQPMPVEPPPVGAPGHGKFRLGKMRQTNATDAKTFENAFKAQERPRSEAEKERARNLGGMGAFGPPK